MMPPTAWKARRTRRILADRSVRASFLSRRFGRWNSNRILPDLGACRIAIDDNLRMQRKAAGRELAAEVDLKVSILSGSDLAGQHHAALAVCHHVTALGR